MKKMMMVCALLVAMVSVGFGEVKETPLIESKPTQEAINQLILVIALLSVPWMLFLKPYFLHKEIKRRELEGDGIQIELGVCSIRKRKLR